MHKIRSRGFTLIELLVVIAIIGILSAVVLASLNTARSKGSDAAVQSDLSSIQTQAEIYYGGVGANTYGGTGTTCTTAGTLFVVDTTIAKAISGADGANGSGSIVCNGSSTGYAVAGQLVADTTKWWCVDSSGSAKQESATLGSGVTTCP